MKAERALVALEESVKFLILLIQMSNKDIYKYINKFI